MKTFCFKLYQSGRKAKLHKQIENTSDKVEEDVKVQIYLRNWFAGSTRCSRKNRQSISTFLPKS